MANLTITNIANSTGVYDGAPMTLAATQAAVVTLIDEITMTFTAEKTRWADNLANLYTATITNTGTEPFELNAGDVIVFTTDAFDSSVVVDPDSVQVTGNNPTGIAVNAGVLSLNLTEAITSTTPTVITFNVYKQGTEPTTP